MDKARSELMPPPPKPYNLKIKLGDILDLQPTENLTLIVNLSHCSSAIDYGFSAELCKKFWHAFFPPIPCKDRQPGHYILAHTEYPTLKIIHVFAQVFPGHAISPEDDPYMGDYEGMDTYEKRCLYFNAALNRLGQKLRDYRNDKVTVVFPYLIGCGSTGGRWKDYLEFIKDFATENPNIEVEIYKLGMDS